MNSIKAIGQQWKWVGLCGAVTFLLWQSPPPPGLQLQAWHLFIIFLGTISLVMSNAFPMGASTLMGLTAALITGAMTFQAAFSGFSNEVTWLVVLAFFISDGFIRSGLGARIGYHLVARLGSSTLGLAYALSGAEFLLSPAIPSVTARAGGILFPIVQSLAHALGSKPGVHAKKAGAFLMVTSFQTAIITSSMFLTAMAANPLIVKLAERMGIVVSWSLWAKAALLPGLVSLLLMPLFIYLIFPPELKRAPEAVKLAQVRLKEMGSLCFSEIMLLLTFVLLLALWSVGSWWGIGATSAALLGLCLLLVTGVISWKDVLASQQAWDAFIWFGALLALGGGLYESGLATWFGQCVGNSLKGMPMGWAVSLLFLIYFYSHYFFASSTAHIGAFYAPFVAVAMELGAPPLLVVLLFAFASNLFGGLTHYGFGPAPIFFGAGFVSLKDWWRIGFLASVLNIFIWCFIGLGWWRFLGLV